MAILVTLDVDDKGTVKIENFTQALAKSGASVSAFGEKVSDSNRQQQQSSKQASDALTDLVSKHQQVIATHQKHASGAAVLSGQLKVGTTVTKEQAAALGVLNTGLQNSTKLTTAQKSSLANLTTAMSTGTTVTQQQAQAMRSLATAIGGGGGGTGGGVNNSLDQFRLKAVAAAAAFAMLAGSSYSYLRQAGELAARVEVLGTVQEIVAKNSFQSNTAMSVAVERIKKLGITTREATDSVIQFAQAELKSADAAKIARVAQDLAVVAGKNSSEAFERLTTAIQVQQPMILRQFGIIKGLEQIYGEYARTVGKSVDKLDAFDKKQAFVNAILKEGIKVQGAYEASMQDVGKQMGSLARHFEEMQLSIGKGLLPLMSMLVLNLTGMLKWFNDLPPEVQGLTTALLAAAAAMAIFSAAVAGAQFLGLVSMIQSVAASIMLLGTAMKTSGVIAGFTSWLTLFNPLGLAVAGVVAGVGALVAGYVYLSGATDRAVEATKKATLAYMGKQQEIEETLKFLREEQDVVYKNQTQWDIYNKQRERLKKLAPELADVWGKEGEKIQFNTEKLEANTKAHEENLKKRRDALKLQIAEMEAQFASMNVNNAGLRGVGTMGGLLADAKELLWDASQRDRLKKGIADLKDLYKALAPGEELKENLERARRNAQDGFAAFADTIEAAYKKIRAAGGGELLDAFESGQKRVKKTRGGKAVTGHERSEGEPVLEDLKPEDYTDILRQITEKVAKYDAELAKRGKSIEQTMKSLGEQAEKNTPQMAALRSFLDKAFGAALKKGDLAEYNRLLELFGGQMARLGTAEEVAAAGAMNVADAMKSLSIEKYREAMHKAAAENEQFAASLNEKVADAVRSFSTELLSMQQDMDARLYDQQVQQADRVRDVTDQLYESRNARYMDDTQRALYEEDKKLKGILRTYEREEIERKRALQHQRDAVNLKAQMAAEEVEIFVRAEEQKTEFALKMQRLQVERMKEGQAKQDALAELKAAEDKYRELTRATLNDYKSKMLQHIEAKRAASQAILDDQERLNERLAASNHQLANAQIAETIRLKDEIITQHRISFRIITGLYESIVGGVLNGFATMITGARSFKDVLIGIWQSIKATLFGIFNDIVQGWIKRTMAMTLSGGGGGVSNGLPGTAFPAAIPGMVGGGGGGGAAGAAGLLAPWKNLWKFTHSGSLAGSLTGGAIGGFAGFGIGSAIGGSTGSYGKGIFGGAGSGAAIGALFGGPIGAGLGALGGLIGGLFGANRERKRTNEMREEFIKAAGGLEELKRKAAEANIPLSRLFDAKNRKDLQKDIERVNKALELREAKDSLPKVLSQMEELRKKAQLVGFDVDHLYSAKTIEAFNKKQEELNKLLEQQEARLNGLGRAASGVGLMVQGLSAQLDRGVDDLTKLMSKEEFAGLQQEWEDRKKAGFTGSMGQIVVEMFRQQADMVKDNPNLKPDEILRGFIKLQEDIEKQFKGISAAATSTFAAMVRETGDVVGAMEAIGESLDGLILVQNLLGTKADAGLQSLMNLRTTIKSNQDVADSLSGITLVLKGLSDAGALNAQTFNDLGFNVSELFNTLTERGVDSNQALLLMQPTLQALWQAQKNFGFATDEATQKLIDMGVEHGLVGANFQSVSQKMLDVLLLIAETLGADIPDAFRTATSGAESQRNEIERNRIEIERARDAWQEYGDTARWATEQGGGEGPDNMPPQFAGGVENFRGGLAWVGERGPELLRLPRGSSVYPMNRIRPADGGNDDLIRALIAEVRALGQRPVEVHSTLKQDGRTVAKSVVRHGPSALRSAGL